MLEHNVREQTIWQYKSTGMHPLHSLHTLSFTYFQLHTKTDKGDQTGFDIILEKHLNGKFAMKDMMEFFRERYQLRVYSIYTV